MGISISLWTDISTVLAVPLSAVEAHIYLLMHGALYGIFGIIRYDKNAISSDHAGKYATSRNLGSHACEETLTTGGEAALELPFPLLPEE